MRPQRFIPIERLNDEALLKLECACVALLAAGDMEKRTADRVYLKLCRIRAVRFEE